MAVPTFEIVRYLDDLLRKGEFKDYTSNGLQVEGAAQVTRVGFAVDACVATFEALQDCQMIVVHHGLWWPSVERLAGADRKRIAALLSRDVNLYVSHLPLDRHPQVGNNARILKGLGLECDEAFGEVGWLGEYAAPVGYDDFVSRVEGFLGTPVLRSLAFGPAQVSRIAVCSGGGGLSYLDKAVGLGADVYLTGEASHPIYHAAREAGLNVVLGGHYATETWGVKALMPYLEETFGVETRFADHPTGF